jgi:hypothetical protein
MITRARVSGCMHSSFVAAVVLVGAATAGGALAGAAFGAAGAVLGPTVRWLLVGLVVLVVVAGALSRERPWQLDRETNVAWLTHENWRTAVYNGLALGVGVSTRLGFWLVYALPTAAFASGDPLFGALIYGLYGLARTGLSAGMAHPRVNDRARMGVLHVSFAARALTDVLCLALAGGVLRALVIGT